ncbi:MAG: hypothetical protein HQL78_14375 [Magnetococcales bacterium]|nr:hypothetical protein [Magnetococcales bacterium]
MRYSPGYSLFDVTYDTGEDVASPQLFENMQLAWFFGHVDKVEIPPVRLIALSDKAAVTGSFKREYYPDGYMNIQFVNDVNKISNESTTDNWVEVAGTRETVTERIQLDETDPDVFVDVEKITYIEGQDQVGRKFKLRMLNDDSQT